LFESELVGGDVLEMAICVEKLLSRPPSACGVYKLQLLIGVLVQFVSVCGVPMRVRNEVPLPVCMAALSYAAKQTGRMHSVKLLYSPMTVQVKKISALGFL